MGTYSHSVSLVTDKCKGCTHCLKRCPTEAIRIRDGHAVIQSERCIDCGECIRLCPYKAKKAQYDSLDSLQDFRWKIALPAPTLYGQFDNLDDVDYVLTGLLECGFDDVYEVAGAAELVSAYTRIYLHGKDIPKPVISSACPVVTRLISVRFPSLCENLLPLLPPVELAARLAKERALANHPELKPEDVGVYFISPCPAKVSYMKNPVGVGKSAVDRVLAISDIYFRLVSAMNKITTPQSLSNTGLIGISWAGSGGESAALFNDKYLAADGVENIIQVLDAIENGNISGLEFVELNACNGGCVGGTLTVENPFIAKARLQSLRRYLPVTQNHLDEGMTEIPTSYMWDDAVQYSPVAMLDRDPVEAMRKMSDIEILNRCLPKLDCGACGAPTCRALAEDIVFGAAQEEDCVIKMRETLNLFRTKHTKPGEQS